ncbi:hypothetical protein EJ05DRAFT_364863 [Pseudovirgaria hyperparasitica]|uniref:Mitochondrial distribution and morphology protein 12 n=1 Tax=Pseudovirgaria hyperparasitica TaxID=470096 RepID=A0A6A6W8D5_9PEZI|nr:uncharacterized protein EJ05DRAFT_364863 [Pseudovirgaria hyperparasitica]KAF2758805.1 hypothetical protein EJ05DRAFT_364863 [Pseudovirgaria hyperparasitica]
MSVDVNWQKLTGGSDGADLAESIRAFIHDKFQQVPLPRFIRSVQVHNFDFGHVAPQIEIKDICDPLPDFYEDDEDDGTENGDGGTDSGAQSALLGSKPSDHPPTLTDPHAKIRGENGQRVDNNSFDYYTRSSGPRASYSSSEQQLPGAPFLSRAPTPGLLGGSSNLSYFHMPFSAGLPGTTTPLAAVAGAQFHHGWPDAHQQHASMREFQPSSRAPAGSITSSSPPSIADPGSRPPSQHLQNSSRPHSPAGSEVDTYETGTFEQLQGEEPPLSEPDANDIQVVSHVKYSGDIKLGITASILLDYPMPSFVEIPIKLNITGITFDGVSILAYIRKKAHFCFLAPEDAESIISNEAPLGTSLEHAATRRQVAGGLLEQIRVESEIGQKEGGKQVLKNVGKVEKFILEQVRRIFEEEFVYPSFWTFLV